MLSEETVTLTIKLPKKTVEAIEEFLLKQHKVYDGKLNIEEFIEKEMMHDVASLIDAICGDEGVYPDATLKKYGLQEHWP